MQRVPQHDNKRTLLRTHSQAARLKHLHSKGTTVYVSCTLRPMQDAGEEGEQEALGGVLRVRSRAKGASGTGDGGEGEGQEGSKEGAAKKDKKGKKKGKQQGAEDGDRFQQVRRGLGRKVGPRTGVEMGTGTEMWM